MQWACESRDYVRLGVKKRVNRFWVLIALRLSHGLLFADLWWIQAKSRQNFLWTVEMGFKANCFNQLLHANLE